MQDFGSSYWVFEETIRRYDPESLRNYYSEVLADIAETSVISTRAVMLDIGCGYGYFMQLCLKKGYDCIGLDISRWALSRAIEKSAKTILFGASSNLPLQSNSIDIVTMLDVIEHLNKPQLALTEIRRILKPEGVLFISTPNLAAIMRGIKGRKWYGFLDKTHISLYTPFHLSRLLKKCGFCVLKCYAPFNVNLPSGLKSKAFRHSLIGGQLRLLARPK